MEFRILGPLQVVDGEREVPLGSPKERALLAVLLLHAGEVVSRDRLIDELWGESPPPTAPKALNVYVSQLRKTLDGDAAIVTRAPGYAIDVESLDAARFESLATEARELVVRGEIRRARGLLAEALALWRGPALAGIELAAATRNEVARLEELRLAAQMDRIDCDLALGRHEQLVGELEALGAQHPLHERLRGQLILALYRSGRQADALAAYRDARETLVQELGIEPSAPLQRLEKAILNQDPSLEVPEGVGDVEPKPVRSEAKRPRPRRLLVAAAVAAVAGAVAATVALTGGGGITVRPNSVAVIDPASNRVVADIGLGNRPGPVAIGAGSVWIGNTDDSTLTRVRPKRRAVLGTTPLPTPPQGIAPTPDAIWVVGAGGAVGVAPYAPTSYTVTHMNNGLGHDTGLVGVVAGAGKVWVTGGRFFARIDPRTRKQIGYAFLNAEVVGPSAIAFASDSVWETNPRAGVLLRYDPRTLDLEQTIPVEGGPAALVARGKDVWVASSRTLARVPGTPHGTDTAVAAVVRLPAQPVALAASHDAVWAAESDGTVVRVDPNAARVVARIRLGRVAPGGIAAGAGAVWVTVDAPPPSA